LGTTRASARGRLRKKPRFKLMKPGVVYVGTSGWSYKSWGKDFYPADLPASKQLHFYVSRFPTVEINRTFYRLPTTKAFGDWNREAPAGFVYSIKGSRAVTHFKRLRPGAKSLGLLLNRSKKLGSHCGPILWQLPASLKKDSERLGKFLRTLRPHFTHAIEFRDPSWIDEEVFAILRRHGIASVAVSSQAMPPCFEVTANFVYVRFHGLKGGAAHDYSERELTPWARFLRESAQNGLNGFAYFNNDMNARAPLNARQLIKMVGPSAASTAAASEGV
jgi:uncharacterized protein YecE (DUF72 family)